MKVQCDQCEGTGYDRDATNDTCQKCKGTGKIDKPAGRLASPGGQGQYTLQKEGKRR